MPSEKAAANHSPAVHHDTLPALKGDNLCHRGPFPNQLFWHLCQDHVPSHQHNPHMELQRVAQGLLDAIGGSFMDHHPSGKTFWQAGVLVDYTLWNYLHVPPMSHMLSPMPYCPIPASIAPLPSVVLGALDKATEEDEQRVKEYEARRTASLASVQKNLEEQEDCWGKIQQLEHQLQQLGTQRFEEIKRRMEDSDAESKRRTVPHALHSA